LSYGRVAYGTDPNQTRGVWRVRCEPHVRARLKRVMPRAPQWAAEYIDIPSSPENARDLLWFLERYPMDVDRPDLLEQLANEHVKMEERIADLMALRRPPLKIELAEPAREYQSFAAQLLEIKRGLLLADDVGLGKTVTAICSMTLPENLPAVVVCPAHMPPQWAAMLARFAPGLSVHILKKGTPYPLTRGVGRGQLELLDDRLPDVIISNYHKLRGWAETLAGVARFVVFDECQQLRRPASDIYRSCDHLAEKTPLRLGLSATPIYNYGAEFFNVVDVLAPGALGESAEFYREWCHGQFGEKARIKDTDQFGAYLRREGIMLRRTRQEVGRELPELTKVIHAVEADDKALDNLKGDAIALAKVVLAHNENYRGERMNAAGKLDSLIRQATGIAKAPYVAEFVKLLLDSEERIVLFGWHREVYSIWLEALKEFKPVLYTGTESVNQKEAAIREFATHHNSRVLIMSLRSGAGVDGLQGTCRTAVFGELDWSPGVHEQCVGRIHRDGQPEPCVAYFLVADQGADPIMVDVLGIKREQIEGVRNPNRALAERVETGENNIKRLAREFLTKRGIEVEQEKGALPIGKEAV
jgi:SNF2 family DNA or RNA helicase